jgi:hypothetical protein|tara:strand:- start:716 stop:961 length:246 start_codon:yes stop_codon:yes gene_type:complete
VFRDHPRLKSDTALKSLLNTYMVDGYKRDGVVKVGGTLSHSEWELWWKEGSEKGVKGPWQEYLDTRNNVTRQYRYVCNISN